MTLPVADICPALLDHLERHNKVLLSAPPGAGKSTYLPLFLLQQPHWHDKTILMLEPRRLAAKSIASYLAARLNETPGQTVGYQIRHEQKVSGQTRLLIVTEGVLLRKIQSDPELSGIDLVIFDEFHERSLQADLALALCLEVQQLNEQLKLLIMSATLDLNALSQQLQAPVLQSEGRSYPVDIRYQPPSNDAVWLQCAKLALRESQAQQGSLLVFLPGQREIEQALQFLLEHNQDPQLDCYALLGALTLEQQQQAIAPSPAGRRKLVLCTNIAETSLTIEGIQLVIDSGQAREAVFHPRHGLTRLETVAISQASATQRAGRAGRLGPGICYRLDSPEQWQRRPAFSKAAILQSELTGLVLESAAWGCAAEQLFWLDNPPAAHLAQARWVLEQLGALDAKGQITRLGQQLVQSGADPRLAAMLHYGRELEQQGEQGAAWLAVVLTTFLEQRRPSGEDNLDQLLSRPLPSALLQQAKLLARQLNISSTFQFPLHLTASLLSRAFPDRIAQKRGKGYQLANGAGVQLFADSGLQGAEFLVVADVLFRDQAIASLVVPWTLPELKQSWQSHLQQQHHVGFDEKAGRFIAQQQLCLGKLVLERKTLTQALTEQDVQQGWLSYLTEHSLQALPWSEPARQLQNRLTLAQQLGVGQFPAMDEVSLLQSAADWLLPYLGRITKVADLARLDLYTLLWQRLDYRQQQELHQYCPDSWRSATGSMIPLYYQDDGAVVLSIRIQEMFGQLETPTIALGKKPLRIELLSPARRPLQLTQDLASFWRNSYQDVKKEMKGRYPKHYWPDDPAQAMPTNKTKKAMQQ
ncbi:ATP-dependent helicase HrpB [Rheinheimera marina]|uniref:ATP-dependent helicase HrpB n=1 Tax=Rheinheimera marina TaxID=1774958 RepID=A0ABV9JLM4_9GAMM